MTEHNGATSMRSKHVHHNGEREDMTAHDEDEKEYLSTTEELASYAAKHDFPCVCHVVHMWMGELELANYKAGVGRENAESCDENNATR